MAEPRRLHKGNRRTAFNPSHCKVTIFYAFFELHKQSYSRRNDFEALQLHYRYRNVTVTDTLQLQLPIRNSYMTVTVTVT